MAIDFTDVQPGQLITSDLCNRMLRALDQLDERVSDLEQSPGTTPDAPQLQSSVPSGNVNVGSLLRLIGRNFVIPTSGNTVEIGDQEVTDFLSGSNDQQLLFQVPSSLTGLPRQLSVRVRNRNGQSNALQIRVSPLFEEQAGNVFFTDQTPALGQIAHAGEYELRWLVDSQTTHPEQYEFSLRFTNLQGSTEDVWRSSAQITPVRAEIPRSTPRVVTARVRVPGDATSADISLHVEAEHSFLSKDSGPKTLTVGETPAVNNTATTIAPQPPVAFDVAAGRRNQVREATTGSGLECAWSSDGVVEVLAHFTEAGRYDFRAEVADPTRWAVDEPSPPDHAAAAVGLDLPIRVRLRNTDTSHSTAPGVLTIRVVKRNAANTADDFQSWIAIPVRGAQGPFN